MDGMNWRDRMAAIASDQRAAPWLKDAVNRCFDRSPVDAANEAAFLAAIMRERLFESIEESGKKDI